MRKEYLHKQFWMYVLPSMFTMLLSGFYAIVDGLFVGNAAGNDALAAINIVYPVQIILNASAIGIGIGGAVLVSTYRGKNDYGSMNRSTGLTLLLLAAAGIVLPIILMLLLPDILHLLGAQGTVYTYAMDYIRVILIGGILPVLGNGLNPLIRNHGKTITATLIMSTGLITNIVLDYYFVFTLHMGLAGAAYATIAAQGIVAVLSCMYLYFDSKEIFHVSSFIWDKEMVKRMLAIGSAPFGQTLVPSVIIILTNWKCIEYGGETAITIFSVVSYILASVQLLLQGIGDGVQPLLSFYHGAKKEKELQILYHKTFFLTLITSVLFSIGVIGLSESLSLLFGIDIQILKACAQAVMITALSFPFLGLARVTSAYFYAAGKAKHSTFLVYLEPCILLPACLLVLSSIFQLDGVWFAYPAAQLLLCMTALIMKRPSRLSSLKEELTAVLPTEFAECKETV